MIASSKALALIPDQLSAIEAALLMCAGVTTFNALRNSGAHVGDVVAILGIGGLGHLAIQFGGKIGFKTIAIARGKDKEEMARKLGALCVDRTLWKNILLYTISIELDKENNF
jgi:D-arabinose 1-dehydrogenase-like Zn-dependent alcohol dehydrogenase